MLWMRGVTGEDVRSTYEWLGKDPPLLLTENVSVTEGLLILTRTYWSLPYSIKR